MCAVSYKFFLSSSSCSADGLSLTQLISAYICHRHTSLETGPDFDGDTMPVMLISNLDVDKKIVNGTLCKGARLHDDKVADDMRRRNMRLG